MPETIQQRIKPTRRSRKKRYRDRKKLKKARTLDVEYLGRDAYNVTGGSEPRTVTIRDHEERDCSCGNSSSPCSHILAVQFYIRRSQEPVRAKRA